MTPPIRKPTVFLVDDDPSVLRALGRLVRSVGWSVAEFRSPQEYLDQHDSAAPGCLVLDMAMPGKNGFELQAALERAGSKLPIIFLTGHGDVAMGVSAMKSGAVDFLCKPCSDEDLVDAIHRALERDRDQRSQRVEAQEIAGLLAALTPREHEVMLGVVAGKRNREIAAELGTGEKTVKVHRSRVMSKLRVASVADLVRLIERAGLRRSEG